MKSSKPFGLRRWTWHTTHILCSNFTEGVRIFVWPLGAWPLEKTKKLIQLELLLHLWSEKPGN